MGSTRSHQRGESKIELGLVRPIGSGEPACSLIATYSGLRGMVYESRSPYLGLSAKVAGIPPRILYEHEVRRLTTQARAESWCLSIDGTILLSLLGRVSWLSCTLTSKQSQNVTKFKRKTFWLVNLFAFERFGVFFCFFFLGRPQ